MKRDRHIKTVLHPIDFIAFDGLNDGAGVSIDILCKKGRTLLKTL